MNNKKQLQKYYSVLCMAIITVLIAMSACGITNPTNIVPVIPDPATPAPVTPNPTNPDPVDPDPVHPVPMKPDLMNYVYTHTTREATLKINPNISAVNIQFPSREYIRFYHTFDRVIPDITQFLYNYFADDFDFIMFSYNEDTAFTGVDFFGAYRAVKNDVMGIGEELFDNTSIYGSKGRLQGVIHFPNRTGLITGPALHEIMHRWGNYVLSSVEPHWGFSSAGGQLGGFTLTNLTHLDHIAENRYKAGVAEFDNFGLVANGGNSIPYSPLELYIAGLIPASEVPDTHVAINPRWFQPGSEFTADRFEVHSIESIIGEHGARVPNHVNSQKQFRVLFAVLSTRDLTTDEWTEVDRMTKQFSFTGADEDTLYNFWEATGGRATIQFSGLAESLILEPDTPIPEPDSLSSMIDSPIVGTWSITHTAFNLTDSYIFEENGMYSQWTEPDSIPSSISDTGTYSIVSDSMLRQCIEYIGGNIIEPPVCNNRSYSIVGQTLTLGRSEFDVGEGILFNRRILRLPERTYTRQTSQSIVGTWERTVSGIKLSATYSEEGNHSETEGEDTNPSTIGTYRNISDSVIELCLTRAGNFVLNPQVCFEAPYRIIHNTLIFEPVRIVFASGPTYVPEIRFVRQTE